MNKPNKIPWLPIYRISQLIVVVYLFVIMFMRTSVILNILVWLLACIGIPRLKSLAKEQNPIKFKVYVRDSRLIYTILSNTLYLVILFAPTIAMEMAPNMLVFTTRCIWIISFLLIIVIGYKDYKWRTMHSDTIKTSGGNKKTS